jgi:hypothetical protein
MMSNLDQGVRPPTGERMGFGLSPAVLVIDMTYAYFDPKSHLSFHIFAASEPRDGQPER